MGCDRHEGGAPPGGEQERACKALQAPCAHGSCACYASVRTEGAQSALHALLLRPYSFSWGADGRSGGGLLL